MLNIIIKIIILTTSKRQMLLGPMFALHNLSWWVECDHLAWDLTIPDVTFKHNRVLYFELGAQYHCSNPFSTGTVFIRQILEYKDGPRKIFLIVVDS